MARLIAAAIAAIALGTMFGGCSDIYYDRRETIALSGGDAVAANEVAQMVDPWPRHSGDKNIAFNGERMQRAVECYRANRVTPPTDLNPTLSTTLTPSILATPCGGQMSSGGAVSQTRMQITPDGNLSSLSTTLSPPTRSPPQNAQ
jgi:hypothetical protein